MARATVGMPGSMLKNGVPLGNSTCNASGSTTAISRGTQPARLMRALWPAMMAPVGRVTTVVTPLARVTGISSESGLMAVLARRSGWKSPPSRKSSVSRADSSSWRPSTVPASIIPGYRCSPSALMTAACGGTVAPPFWPTARMRPCSKTTVALGTTGPVTGCSVTPRIATGRFVFAGRFLRASRGAAGPATAAGSGRMVRSRLK